MDREREQARREARAKAEWKMRAESGLCEYCDKPSTVHGLGIVTGLRKVVCDQHARVIQPGTMEWL